MATENVVISGEVVDHCQNADCANGNCPGCIDGNLFCDDPRCHPNCEDCSPPEDNNFVTVLIVIFVIIGLITLCFLFYFIWRANRSDEISPYYISQPRSTNQAPTASVIRMTPTIQNIPHIATIPIITDQSTIFGQSVISPQISNIGKLSSGNSPDLLQSNKIGTPPISSATTPSMILGFEKISATN